MAHHVWRYSTSRGAALVLLLLLLLATEALREFRPWSRRTECEKAQDPNYPFSYQKYYKQSGTETKARVISNQQDFRHKCQVRGGTSKCHICEDIICKSKKNGTCFLQLQGVDPAKMTRNLPVVTDTAWAVGGKHRKDFGGSTVSHFCVFTSGYGYTNSGTGWVATKCTDPTTTKFTNCHLRCFGHFGWMTAQKPKRAVYKVAPNATIVDQYPGMGRWQDDGQVDIWAYPRNCEELASQFGYQWQKDPKKPNDRPFNPQGYAFTLAGRRESGFMDGSSNVAQFNAPTDLAVDVNGTVYVADTMNNAIRVVWPDGSVKTLAGKGNRTVGMKDGDCSVATFSQPKGIDVRAKYKSASLTDVVVIVADTANHRIRRIDISGLNIASKSWTKCTVRCLTGLCGNNTISATDLLRKATPYSGYADGLGNISRFSAPEDVLIMDSGKYIIVADTGNFLLRWVWANGTTFTMAGKVIHGLKDSSGKPLPGCQPPCLGGQSGFRDGNLTEAEFMNPVKISKGMNDVSIYVADDHRIRLVELAHRLSDLWGIKSSGRVSTVAGDASQGVGDGLGTEAHFFNPQGVFVTSDGVAYVADQGSCRIRRISPIALIAQSIEYKTQAVTLIRPSGCTSFDQPFDLSGYKITRVEKNLQYNLGYPYESDQNRGRYIKNCVGVPPPDLLQKHFLNVTDSAIQNNLAVKGIAAATVVSQRLITIDTSGGLKFVELFQTGMIISKQTGKGIPANTFISNFTVKSGNDYLATVSLNNPVSVTANDVIVGFGDNLVVDDGRVSLNEDSEQGMAVMVSCTDSCSQLIAKLSPKPADFSKLSPFDNILLEGTKWYSEDSSVCVAAVHSGVLTSARDDCKGYIRVVFQRFDYLRGLRSSPLVPGPFEKGSIRNITCSSSTCHYRSTDMSKDSPPFRVFSVEKRAVSEMVVHTVAGHPSAPLSSGCGYADSQPATLAYFNKPSGIATRPGSNALSDKNFIYIADTNNNMIRGLTASCTQICENGGACVGPDKCSCISGWTGEDCTTPTCSTPCIDNQVCVAPNTCSCKPGYYTKGLPAGSTPPTSPGTCTDALCAQTCYNDGTCDAPDMCKCKSGWFDSNCTTPICSKTCANGGNCTAPDTCSCPSQWKGDDCRVPICKQKCLNNGYCVAPDTCACPPQYTNYDCSAPVCTQGFFVANQDPESNKYYIPASSANLAKMETYRPCDLQTWCNFTREFECDQPSITYDTISVPSGSSYRNKTGRADRPLQCMNIEVPPDFITPYELLNADGTTTSIPGPRRYSPKTPYYSDSRNVERGYLQATPGLTGPWTYSTDRQIANVAWYNITQGMYVCANGGNCTAPDQCQCAPGWMGFDCRTPICEQGYYHPEQPYYVQSEDGAYLRSGQDQELDLFLKFMNATNATALRGHYMNPTYTIQFEELGSSNPREVHLSRVFKTRGGTRYNSSSGKQGGYRCSIRAMTKFENLTQLSPCPFTSTVDGCSYVLVNPNYYSRYMDKKVAGGELDGIQYTFWEKMGWPPLHHKSRILDITKNNVRDANFPCDSCFSKGTPECDQCFFDPKKNDFLTDNRGVYRLSNISYAYTNEGWRRRGEWNATGHPWRYGICVIEFFRKCSGGGTTPKEAAARRQKSFDMYRNSYNVYSMDPDLSYRPRISYTDERVKHQGRWNVLGGECVDQVVRGCYNNGTCVAPNTCKCAPGWSGYDCTKPICSQECRHKGFCSFPNTCTCEKGWKGPDCSIPICAQDCLNDGVCVAPDTCKCTQWENTFRDGRLNGGRPLFQDQFGNPLQTGWTGFDCGTPICVQATNFFLNIAGSISSRHTAWKFKIPDPPLAVNGNPLPLAKLGGHGGDNRLGCLDPTTGQQQPRCPQYNVYVVGNEGASFQGGCGWDHYDSGCCEDAKTLGSVKCYVCPPALRDVTNTTFFCHGKYDEFTFQATDLTALGHPYQGSPITFLKDDSNIKYCGRYHRPRYHVPGTTTEDMGVVRYYTDFLYRPKYSNRNYLNTLTSNTFLCNVDVWEQGDYHDDAGLSSVQGMGSVYPLDPHGRHIRVNYANMKQDIVTGIFKLGPKIIGEGVYGCVNAGSCVAPDICSCSDGYDGYDCNTPLCRHLQPSGTVSSCNNGGICSSKDSCDCVKVPSLLHELHPETTAGLTGWSGSDCTIPICVQGYYDPFCTDLPEAPAGEGCYRCSNGGNCTAPDTCTCAPNWGGFDCRTPLCHTVADPLTRTQLATVFEDKIISFEEDPCGYEALYGVRGWKGTKYARGNCTQPNVCSCLCKDTYSAKDCKKTGKHCNGPWQDTLAKYRNVLTSRSTGLGFDGSWVFGSTDCAKGFEGNVNDMDQFTSCHLTIYQPSFLERQTVQMVAGLVIAGVVISVVYYFVAARLKQKFLLAKIERRRSKRSSEESLLRASSFGRKSSLERKSSMEAGRKSSAMS